MAGCHHESCRGKQWADLRAALGDPARRPPGDARGRSTAPPPSDASAAAVAVSPDGEPTADGGDATDAPPAPSWVRLADIEPERVEWLWKGRIPRSKVTLLEGDPDEGKTLVAIDIAARVTRGMLMPDTIATGIEVVEPGGVVFITAEDGLGDTIRPRFDAAGGDPERVLVFPLDALPELNPEGLAIIEASVAQIGARLVVLDPLNAFLPDRVDTHQDKQVRRALQPLAALADRTGVAVLVIRHLNKSGGQNAKYRGGGSIGIIGAARSDLLVAPDPADATRKVLALVKHNLAAESPALGYELIGNTASGVTAVQVRWLGETTYSARDLLAEPEDDEGQSTLDEARR